MTSVDKDQNKQLWNGTDAEFPVYTLAACAKCVEPIVSALGDILTYVW